jgi:hypothetical protein
LEETGEFCITVIGGCACVRTRLPHISNNARPYVTTNYLKNIYINKTITRERESNYLPKKLLFIAGRRPETDLS